MTVPPSDPGNLGRKTGLGKRLSIVRRSDLVVGVVSSLAWLLINAALTHSWGPEARPAASTSPTDGFSPLEQPRDPEMLARQIPLATRNQSRDRSESDTPAPLSLPAIGARRTVTSPVHHSQYQSIAFQETDPGIPLDLYGEPLLPNPSPKTISYMGGESPRPNESQPLLIPGGMAPPTESDTDPTPVSGQTLVSGELTTVETPHAGAAGRYKLHDAQGQELLIILTPLIVRGDEDIDRLQREVVQRLASIDGNEEQKPARRLVSRDCSLDPFPPAPPVDRETETETDSEEGQIPEDFAPDSLFSITPPQNASYDPWSQLSDPSATSLPQDRPTDLVEQPKSVSDVLREPRASRSEQTRAGDTAPKMKWVFPSWNRFASERGPLSTQDVPSREPQLPERESDTSPMRKTDPARSSKIKPSSYSPPPRRR